MSKKSTVDMTASSTKKVNNKGDVCGKRERNGQKLAAERRSETRRQLREGINSA